MGDALKARIAWKNAAGSVNRAREGLTLLRAG